MVIGHGNGGGGGVWVEYLPLIHCFHGYKYINMYNWSDEATLLTNSFLTLQLINLSQISRGISLFQSNAHRWVEHVSLITPSLNTPLSAYRRLLTPYLPLRAFEGWAGQEPPAEADLIQHLSPSMVRLIPQTDNHLVVSVATLKYLSEPDACCSTCKQSMCHQVLCSKC